MPPRDRTAWYEANREKRLAYARAWYAAHRDKQVAKHKARYHATRAIRKIEDARARMLRQAFADAAHADGCVDCGNKNLGVLQSDHVRGKKLAGISKLVMGKRPLRLLFAELDKCETRCANCHALVTMSRRRARAA